MPIWPAPTGTGQRALGAVSSVVPGAAVNLPFPLPENPWKNSFWRDRPSSPGRSRCRKTSLVLSHIFRHIPIPMPLWNLWNGFFPKPYPPRGYAVFPLPPDRTVYRRKRLPSLTLWKSAFRTNLSGWSWAYRPFTMPPRISSDADMTWAALKNPMPRFNRWGFRLLSISFWDCRGKLVPKC